MAGRIRDADITEVRNRTRVEEIVEEYVALRKAGVLAADGNIVKVHNRRGALENSILYQNGQE